MGGTHTAYRPERCAVQKAPTLLGKARYQMPDSPTP